MSQPTLSTERLIVRPFTLADAPRVQELASARELAATTANIPHPYADGMAEAWISTHADNFAQQRGVSFALTLRSDGMLCGAVGVMLTMAHRHGELGYWIGLPFWNQGYATEAAQAIVSYAFQAFDLHRIFARHMASNPASGRVMQKIGMTYEGCMRQHQLKWDVFEDMALYGVLRSEWPPI